MNVMAAIAGNRDGSDDHEGVDGFGGVTDNGSNNHEDYNNDLGSEHLEGSDKHIEPNQTDIRLTI